MNNKNNSYPKCYDPQNGFYKKYFNFANSFLFKRNKDYNRQSSLKINRDKFYQSYRNVANRLLKAIHPNKTRSQIFKMISMRYASNEEHGNRMYKYMIDKWFASSTPVMANLVEKNKPYPGHPISCFLSESNESGLYKLLSSTIEISRGGGGLGTVWDKTGSFTDGKKNDKYQMNRHGVIAPMTTLSRVMRYTAGTARRVGSVCHWLSVDHSDFMEFLDMRVHRFNTDDDKKAPRYSHHGAILTDKFMQAVIQDKQWYFKDPVSKIVTKEMKARAVFDEILSVRMKNGEPFIFFKDTANKTRALHHKALGLEIQTTNLCTEITLITGKDHKNKERIAVCCLGSINLIKWNEIKDNKQFFEDLYEFYDNILSIFIHEVANTDNGQIYKNEVNYMGPKYAKLEKENLKIAEKNRNPLLPAIYSAYASRDIGIGVVGFHEYLQRLGLSVESEEASKVNKRIFDKLRKRADEASRNRGIKVGFCQDYIDYIQLYTCVQFIIFSIKLQNKSIILQKIGEFWANRLLECERFSYKLAIAPTTTLSYLMETTPCVEIGTLSSVHKNQEASEKVTNPLFLELLTTKGYSEKKIRKAIIDVCNGQYQEYITKEEYEIFKDGYHVNSQQIIKLAGARNIDQAQSINLYIPDTVNINDLRNLHISAFRNGVKTLYYLRSTPHTKPINNCKMCD